MFNRYPTAIAATLVLVGCATYGNSPEEIEAYASLLYDSGMCAQTGRIDQDTAAKGIAYAQSQIYRDETPRLQAKLQEYLQQRRNPNCDYTALRIKTAIASASLKAGSSPQSSSSQSSQSTTQCSTYFGQTHCDTIKY